MWEGLVGVSSSVWRGEKVGGEEVLGGVLEWGGLVDAWFWKMAKSKPNAGLKMAFGSTVRPIRRQDLIGKLLRNLLRKMGGLGM